MVNRCQVRTLLRTVGYVAGLSLGVTAAMAGAPKPSDGRNQHMLATPFWADGINPNQVQVVPGGDGEFEPQGGQRTDFCTAGGDANGYDRPIGMTVYPTVILGQFNLEEFYCADDFTPTNSGNVNQVCWTGYFSTNVCDGDDTTAPDQWNVNFYNFDPGTGLPGTIIASFANHGGTPNMVVAQGPTGLPVGINPSLTEHVFSAALGSNVAVSAGTCYYVELFFNTNRPCFYNQSLSYEPSTETTAEGNRSFLRRNNRLFPAYQSLDFINLDMTIKIGFTAANTLAPSNAFLSCFERGPAANDNIGGATTSLACGSSTGFDNTYYTHLAAPLDPYSCRKSVIDPVDQTAGDIWFRFNPGANATATVSLCGTDTLGGLSGGDSLVSIFRLTVPANGVNVNNLTQVGCSDDACAGGFSEANMTLLTNQNYYIRVSSFTPVDMGIYNLRVFCPTPVAANDLCTTATQITQSAYTMPLGTTLNNQQTRTATTDGNVRGCGGIGMQSRGVWYKLTGLGNSVLLSTDVPTNGTIFDTYLTVYCGSCTTGGGSMLNCVAFNDDVSDTVAQSELDFCAKAGVEYFIWVGGFGGAVGDFALLARQLTDVSNQPVVCCDPQVCDEPCDFEIPANFIVENGENDNGPTVNTTEPCAIPGAYTLAGGGNLTQFNDACTLTPPAGEDRRYGKISEGQTISGNLWSVSSIQARDRDWFLFEDLEPWPDPVTIPPAIGTPGYDHATRQARTIVRYGFASEGPLRPRFYDWGAIVDFSDCTPALGFVFNDLFGCPQVLDKSHVFEGSATSQTGVTPNGRTMAFLIFHLSNGDGYPCGTNTRYWLTLEEAFPLASCVEVATQVGDQDEGATAGPTSMPTFSGTANTDGFDRGEPCYDFDPDGTRVPADPLQACTSGCDSVQRMAGCGASPITNDRFLAVTPNTPFVGKLESKIGASGATRDIDYFKMTISGPKAYVGLSVESAYVMTALITDDNCGADAITHSIAATRGHCIGGGADADDKVLLNGNGAVYIVFVFATDSFVAVGSGAMFANYFCADANAKYRCTITADPVPDCSATPICQGVTVTEAEVCVTDAELMYDACDALGDDSSIVAGDNDGCSESVFAADAIAAGPAASSVCGSLFSTYLPFPDDVFNVDQDYWQFQVTTACKLTYSLRADGSARVLVAETGAPTGIAGQRDKNGGSLCYDADNPLRVLGGEDAGACTDGTVGTLYLQPGWYSMIVSPGTVDIGLSVGDYSCGMEINYALTIQCTEIGTCCVGDDCLITTQAECSSLSGTDWDQAESCGPTYTLAAGAGGVTSIVAAPGAVQILGLGDDEVVASSMGAPFMLYGQTYNPADLGVGSNGYIVLGNADVTAIARAFPNTAEPNAMVAPLLADWDLNAAGSSVWVQTTGALGNEVTTVEWNNVALLDNFNSRATFQVQLIRPSMKIQFNYGTFTNLAKEDISTADGDPITMSSGIEDGCGIDGVNHGLTPAFLTGNKMAMFTKDLDTECFTQPPTCCPGDADSSGVVNFADITSVLANFNAVGTPGQQNPGDADCSGVTNFADITAVLANFNSVCP